MFASLLTERVQQLHNLAEKLAAVLDLGRLKYKCLKTPCTWEIPLCQEVPDLQQHGQSQQVPGGEQPVGHSTHPPL